MSKRRNDDDDDEGGFSEEIFADDSQPVEDLVEATQDQLQLGGRERDEDGIIHETIPIDGADPLGDEDEPPAFSEDDLDDFETSLPNSP